MNIGTDIKTKKNNGVVKEFTNACFWISLKHQLKRLGIVTKVRELRKLAGYTGGNRDMLDFSDYKHKEEVDKVLNYYNIGIALYVVRNGKISHISLMGNTFCRIIVPMLYYEFIHFEAIINQPFRYGIHQQNSKNQLEFLNLPIVSFTS